MGTKLTVTKHKPCVICNQTAHNTSDIKSEPKQHYFYKNTDYKWMKNNVEDLALVQN